MRSCFFILLLMRVSDILEHYWIIGFILLTTGTCIAWLVYGLMSVGNRGMIYLFVVFCQHTGHRQLREELRACYLHFHFHLSTIMCFTTYLANFYKHPAWVYALSFIFDSNLKQYFKYGKRYSKYGKSRRERTRFRISKEGSLYLSNLSLHTQGETLQDIKSALDISQTTAYRILNTFGPSGLFDL